MFPRHDTMQFSSRPSAARRGLMACNMSHRHSLIWSGALCLLLAASLVGAETPAAPAAGGGGMAAPVARSEVFTNANQLKLKGAIAAVNFYYGGAGNAVADDAAVIVTGPIQGVAFDNLDLCKCNTNTVELAGGVKLTVDLPQNPDAAEFARWVGRTPWTRESVARTIAGEGNDGKHAAELATANVRFTQYGFKNERAGILTFALGDRFANKAVSVQVIAGGPWAGPPDGLIDVTDGTRTVGTVGDGNMATAKILTFTAKADDEGGVAVGFYKKDDSNKWLGIAGVIVSAAEASAAPPARVAAPTADATAAGKGEERPRKIYAFYMGCYLSGTKGAWTIKSLDTPRSILYGETGRYLKPLERNIGAWATRSSGGRPAGGTFNRPLVPPGPNVPRKEWEDLLDREIRQAMRIGIDGFAVDATGGEFAYEQLDLMFKICEEKDYPFEITVVPLQGVDVMPQEKPYTGSLLKSAKMVKWLLDKHGNSPKLARRDGKPLIFTYGAQAYVDSYIQKVVLKNLEPGSEAYKRESERLLGSLHRRGHPPPPGKEVWELYWPAFIWMDKQIGQPCYWVSDMWGSGPKKEDELEFVRILAQDFPAIYRFLSLNYFPQCAEAGTIVVAAGKEWSQPIQLQYKSGGVSPGLDWLHRDWKAAREIPSTLLNYITWNDWGETALAPGSDTRYAYYDLTGEFIRWWKTGKEPTADHDKVYIFSHKLAPNTKIYPFKGGVAHFDHVIEVLTILPKPAQLRMPGRKTTEGEAEWTAPAGMSYRQFPLTPGPVSVELLRAGKVELTLAHPEPVSDRPFRPDLNKTAVCTEELRHWQEDFGKEVPMYVYSEYGDANNNGLPNWFEMLWFGEFGDMSTATNCPDPNVMTPSGKTLLECYREQIDPTQKIPSYADLPKTGLLAWYRADQGVEADAAGKIGKWLDQSGNGLHLAVAGGAEAQKPSLAKNAWNGLPAVELDGNGNAMSCPLPQKDHASMSVVAVFTAHAEEQVSRIQDGRINRLVSIPTTSKLDSEGGLAMLVTSIDLPDGDVGVVSRKFDPGQQPTFIGLGAMTDNKGQMGTWNFKGQVAEILIYSPALSEAETYTVGNMLKVRYKR